jgi:hypothetical protein
MLDRTGGTGTGHAAIGATVDFRGKHLVKESRADTPTRRYDSLAPPEAPGQVKFMLTKT